MEDFFLTKPELDAGSSYGVIPVQNLDAAGKTAGAALQAAVDGEDNLAIFIFAVKSGGTKPDSRFQTGIFFQARPDLDMGISDRFKHIKSKFRL
jgi:hypothetical protein